uniref:YihY/virulence factor BrkB family protein n=1 Tax=Candidatus Electronema sp. TaxID=2698783 RepID=UPI0040572B56
MTAAAPAAPPCRLTRWAFAYRPDEGKPAAALRSLLRILLIMGHEFSGSNISLRASALTFSVVLAMVPLLAMSTAILKGLGNGSQMRIAAYRLIDQLDPDAAAKAVQQQEQQDESAEDLTEPAVPEPISLNRHLHNAVDFIFDYVENTNFAALGAFGIVGLLIVVITVLNAVEDAMNAIWHTRRGRSAFRKLMDYLALLVLLPISVNIALAAEAVLKSQKIMNYIETALPSSWLLLKLLPFLFITLSLMMMYLFFPSVKVRTGAALCGALFGAVFWFIVQRLYVMLQMGVANYNAIYGSFATVPLFLVWMQLGWMFILLGAVLAYAIQNRNHYRLPGAESTARQRLQQAFDVLLTVYGNFSRAEATGEEELAAVCAVRNEADLSQTVDLLISGGLLHETEQNGAAAYIPSRPAEQLTAAQVVRLVFGRGSEKESEGGRLAAQVVQAAEEAVPPEDFPARSSAVVTTSI